MCMNGLTFNSEHRGLVGCSNPPGLSTVGRAGVDPHRGPVLLARRMCAGSLCYGMFERDALLELTACYCVWVDITLMRSEGGPDSLAVEPTA